MTQRLMGVEKRLLILIQRLKSNTSCQVRVSASGTLSELIPINRGVKQTPALFNFYINDLAPELAEIDSHCPKLGMLQIPLLLLYIHDMVLISHGWLRAAWNIQLIIIYSLTMRNFSLDFSFWENTETMHLGI